MRYEVVIEGQRTYVTADSPHAAIVRALEHRRVQLAVIERPDLEQGWRRPVQPVAGYR